MAVVEHSAVAKSRYAYDLDMFSLAVKVVTLISYIRNAYRSKYYKLVIIPEPRFWDQKAVKW